VSCYMYTKLHKDCYTYKLQGHLISLFLFFQNKEIRFLIQNFLKQRDALSPLLFNFAGEYAIRKA
jgi:hypothetical protein